MRRFKPNQKVMLPSGEVKVKVAYATHIAFKVPDSDSVYLYKYADFAALVDAGKDKARIQAAIDLLTGFLMEGFDDAENWRMWEVLKALDPETHHDD